MATVATSADDVFINCPFDDAFAHTFQLLIFAILACGFLPRSARELDDGGQTRIDKLYGLIDECRYGVHDLSRTKLDAVHSLPRFNMPLELKLFLGCQALEARDWLANVSRRELPSADRVRRVYEAFLVDLPDLAAALELEADRIPYVDFERIVATWLVEALAAVGA